MMRKNRLKTLHIKFVLTIFYIFVLASFISAILFFILSKFEKFYSVTTTPFLRLIVILLTCIIIGTMISLIISRRFLKPINDLVLGTKEIAKGNFNVKIDSNASTDELKKLIENFNFMADKLKNVDLIHNDFITDFSHEFNTPLASIQGFANQLNNPSISEKEKQESIQIIVEETERLSHLATNILLFSKIEKKQPLSIAKSAFQLDEQLRICILLLQNDWESKDLSFTLNLLPLKINADQELLKQVWLNLIKNAIRYSHHGGTIIISCYTFGYNVKITVKDNGIGMNDYVRERIFDKFYQGDNSHNTLGNGLGLTIATKIINLHQGKISVKSKEKQGSTFVVILPSIQIKNVHGN